MAQRALTPGKAAYCSECGAETLPDAASCARCGQPFEGTFQAVLCPICNSINRVDAGECANCNAKFPEPGSVVPSKPSAEGSPEEEYLRRILQLSREKAQSRVRLDASGQEPGSHVEPERGEREMEGALWKLAEPFDRLMERRRRRLEQMDGLITRARSRIRALESSNDAAHVRERDDLKRQIEGLLLEKEDIVKLEEGLMEMERTYRNILRMQKDELKAREMTLRGRIAAFRQELESRTKAFGQLKERESDIARREEEFRTVMTRLNEQQNELQKREEHLRDKARLLDERHHALSEGEVGLERKRWEFEQRAAGGRGAPKGEPTLTVRSDAELAELKNRMVQLEEQMERLVEERNQLAEQQKESLRLRDDLKLVMKDVDELLGDLPSDKIRNFAKSKKFALYEKLLETLEL